jgi:hypothetical protein
VIGSAGGWFANKAAGVTLTAFAGAAVLHDVSAIKIAITIPLASRTKIPPETEKPLKPKIFKVL